MYMQDANMMAFAAIFLALSGWTSGLTKRVALKFLAMSGGEFRKCSYLTVALSALLSMWFPDTAVMMFMIGVMEKMLVELNSTISLGSLGDARMGQMKAIEQKIKDEAAAELNAETELGNIKKLLETADDTTNVDEESSQAGAESEQPYSGLKEEQIYSSNDSENADKMQMFIDETIFKLENEKILSTFSLNILHSVGIIVNIGGLFWPFCSTGAIQLMSRAGVVDMGVWMSFVGPVMAIMLPFTIWYLDFISFILPSICSAKRKVKPENQPPRIQRRSLDIEIADTTRQNLESHYNAEYAALGKFTSYEKGLITVLALTEGLCIISDTRFCGGWSASLAKEGGVHAKVSTIAMFLAIFSFVFPKCGSDMFRGPKSPTDKASFTALLGWKIIQAQFPWGLLIFIGGGLAIGCGSRASQLSDSMGGTLVGLLGNSSFYVYLLVLMVMTFVLACLVSNTAAAGIAIQITVYISNNQHIRPHLLLIPCVAVSAFAFVHPAGTPALALLHMRTQDKPIWQYFLMGSPLTLLGFVLIYVVGICCNLVG
ncbi:solute carrier family 13 member 2 [Folsomia candida]|nr:solute carrier family 13 member 2 [Folsomia candida]